MGRNTFLEILVFFLIVLDGSNASFGWEHRKLAASDPSKNETAVQDPPLPTPVPGDNSSDPKPIGETNNNETDPVSTNDTQKVDPKGLNDTVSPIFPPIAKMGNETVDPNRLNSNNSASANPPPVTKTNDEKKDHEKEEAKDEGKNHEKVKEKDEGKSPEKEKEKDEGKSPEEEKERDGGKSYEKEKEKNEGNNIQQSNTDKTCDGLSPSCHDNNKMVGCIFETGSKYLVVLVQNGEESDIKVNISSMESNLGDAEVAKHQTAMINVTLTSSGITKVTLNAGQGYCDLQMGIPVPEGKFFVRLPSYEKLLTPVNGAYFLIITVIVFGGTWACCKFRMKKRHDGIQYQELEMALPESATNVETADGWDQSWDDDWDEDMAVKSPGRLVASISANGLTSRSSNKDGWENNWDD